MGEYRGDIPTWIGRQPLFDAQMDVRAYQLLAARSGDDGEAAPAPDVAARFWTTFIELGLEEVSSSQPAYLAVDRDFLLAGCATLFADERVAFEIPADLPLDPTLRTCIDRLVRDGYRFVLDDFRPAAEPAPRCSRSPAA
ncbi:MAG: hypothetical protein R3F20_14200 [Planctomycetota bacterium]